ncbi:MAG: tetratricopeptide repeat protein [Candidatus Omnitrophica bacterium]|nr:tetratricopeptide repeat protein [Candidatus Omnitrophota bacterium]
MNHPDFTQIRRDVDEAITFNDRLKAKALAAEGLRQAQEKECLGEVMYFQAQLKIIEENFLEAICYLDQAIGYNSSDGAAFNDKALCLVELGMIDGVEELFNEGIDVEPDYATIHHNKGWFLNNLGRHREALGCFEKALKLEPGRVVTYENMADAYENIGLMAEALKSYKKALALMRLSGPIRNQIEREIRRLEGSGD